MCNGFASVPCLSCLVLTETIAPNVNKHMDGERSEEITLPCSSQSDSITSNDTANTSSNGNISLHYLLLASLYLQSYFTIWTK